MMIVCGYVYDPAIGDEENGIALGTSFADLPRNGFAQDAVSKKSILKK